MIKFYEFFLMLILIVIDQVTKFLAVLKLDQVIEVIKDFFYLRLVYNQGAAWSILEGQLWFFYIISVIAIILFGYYLYKSKSTLIRLSLVLVLAGTIGNFIDRLFLKAVRDFLDFYIFGYNYPVFNMADTFLTIGVALIIIDTIFLNKETN